MTTLFIQSVFVNKPKKYLQIQIFNDFSIGFFVKLASNLNINDKIQKKSIFFANKVKGSPEYHENKFHENKSIVGCTRAAAAAATHVFGHG